MVESRFSRPALIDGLANAQKEIFPLPIFSVYHMIAKYLTQIVRFADDTATLQTQVCYT